MPLRQPSRRFWSSVDLTGNQTRRWRALPRNGFWSSVDLTGNQTQYQHSQLRLMFWSSVDLTGNQTSRYIGAGKVRFGAVSI